MPHGRACGTQDTFKFQTGEHIWMTFVVIELFIRGRVMYGSTGRQNDRTYFNVSFDLFLIMDHSIGYTCLYTLIALTAVSAVQAAVRFTLSRIFVIAEFHFFEVTLSFLNSKLGHFGSGSLWFIFGNRAVNYIFF